MKKISGKDLIQIGYKEGMVIGNALDILNKHYKGKSKKQQLEIMQRVKDTPALYKDHHVLGTIAQRLLDSKTRETNYEAALNPLAVKYKIYGKEDIESGALQQMDIAMRLPITLSGALMPDAHQGYGLPIGGVLATDNAVIPYGVGVDIGCRMCMSVYDISTDLLQKKKEYIRQLLLKNTRFGREVFKKPADSPVMEYSQFAEISILRSLKDRAYSQMGSSGGGNHFVEFGMIDIKEKNEYYNLPQGKFLAILSHSGSRGLGANIARHYTKIAMEQCKLPSEARHLAWLDLNSEIGQEYWSAMNLAGDYASACHHQIHQKMAHALNENPVVMIENHHNFAWKEKDVQGRDIIVHRKGATPAGENVLGIIPGSMTSPGFVVAGKGDFQSINSASHGAGRVMSRRQAKKTLIEKNVNRFIHQAGVEVIGSGLDEAPMVYKDIHKVMNYQQDLVKILATFHPKIVRMCGDKQFKEVD